LVSTTNINSAHMEASEVKGRYRVFPGAKGTVIRIASACFTLFCLLYVSGVLSDLRLYLLSNQYNAIFLTAVLVLVFLLIPAGKGAPRDRLPWYDILLIIASLPGNLYVIINAVHLLDMIKLRATPFETALGVITILTMAEALRRTLGWAMIVIASLFVIYMKYGYLLGGFMGLSHYTWGHVMMDVYLSVDGIYGNILGLAGNVIITFIAFGALFNAVGGGNFFINLALAAMGMVRGGAAKVSIVGSALFGTLSGSPIANVMVTGMFTIPLMKRTGYQSHFAGAVETVASTGGALMPPIMGIVAFVMAEMLETSYRTIALTAAIPALLYFTSLFLQTDLRAVKLGLKGIPRQELPSLKETLKEGWELLLPFLLLIFFLFVMRYPAAISAIYTLIGLFLISLFRKQRRLNLKKLIMCLENAARGVLDIGVLTALAGIIIGVLMVTGLGPKISAGLVTLAGGSVLALVILAGIACYIMGMGVSAVATYIVLAALVAPALIRADVPPMVSHFFIFYMGLTTFFTPPFCPAAFVAATIAEAPPFRIGFQSMRLGIVCFVVPFVIMYNPGLLMIGAPGEIALVTFSAFIGISAVSFATERYLFSRTNWPQTGLLLCGALAMIIPDIKTDLIGLGIISLVVLWQWQSSKKHKIEISNQGLMNS